MLLWIAVGMPQNISIVAICSHYDAQPLQRQVLLANRVKGVSKVLHINVDVISEAIYENRQIQFRYRKAFEFLGLKGKYNNHDWRATFGTQLKESGMSSATVADLMGHADTRMVETTYARTRHEGVMKQRNMLELLNADYAGAISAET